MLSWVKVPPPLTLPALPGEHSALRADFSPLIATRLVSESVASSGCQAPFDPAATAAYGRAVRKRSRARLLDAEVSDLEIIASDLFTNTHALVPLAVAEEPQDARAAAPIRVAKP